MEEETQPNQRKPNYARMDYTSEDGILVLKILRLPISERDTDYLCSVFSGLLHVYGGDILNAVAHIYTSDLVSRRLAINPPQHPSLRKTSSLDLAAVRFWERARDIQLEGRMNNGETLGDIFADIERKRKEEEERKAKERNALENRFDEDW